MKYAETIDYLFNLQKYGMKFGLDNIRRLMAVLGEPQRSFRAVHVAGTNGKGSTCAMIESVLRTAGVRTGLFTSPHLVSFTERIRVDGREISEQDVVRLAADVRAAVAAFDDFQPTFFEVVTALGFLYFREQGVQWAVIEVGMGGRLDATNVLVPEVSVITPVSIDHQEFLGTTLAEISREKAGIIKPGVPVVLAEQQPEVMHVLEQTARERDSRLYRYGREYSISAGHGGSFSYQGASVYEGLVAGLMGSYQQLNAATAIKAVEVACGMQADLRCDIPRGIAEVRWPGRLDMVKEHPRVMIDGAHNPAAAEALAAELRKRAGQGERIVMVIGVMGDKDVRGVLAPLLPLAAEIIFTAPAYGRSASVDLLQAVASELGFPSRAVPNVAEAVKAAEAAADSGLVVVTGSFYTIGEAKEALGQKGVLSRLRE